MAGEYLAFFSYATVDWDAPADGQSIQTLVNGIEAQVHAATGTKQFTLWRDENELRWGDQWKAELARVIGESHLFIALLSPTWLNSDYCRLEYETFRQRAAELGGVGRVLPILLREIDQDHLDGLNEGQRKLYDELRDIQMKFWKNIPLVDGADLRKLLKTAADEIRVRLSELNKQTQEQPESTATPPNNESADNAAPVDGHLIPPVSGDYHCPSQGQGGCLLRLAVAGLSEVQTDHGSVLFEISGLTVQTKVSGAKIINDNPDFATSWQGPIARVTRIQTGPQITALSIEALTSGLRGEPLVAKGESGHVRLFDLEKTDGESLTVKGTVRIARRAIKVIPVGVDPECTQTERDKMIQTLTDILMEKHLHDDAALEEWSDA